MKFRRACENRLHSSQAIKSGNFLVALPQLPVIILSRIDLGRLHRDT